MLDPSVLSLNTFKWLYVTTEEFSDRFYVEYCIVLLLAIVLVRLCGLVVRVPGYRSRGPGSIPGTTRFSEKWFWNGVYSAS
jgi:hypothetical protein